MGNSNIRILFGLILVLCLSLVPVIAISLPLDVQRAAFIKAEYALNHNRRIEFFLLSNSLRGYPLYPYLLYADIYKNMDNLPEREVASFLQSYADTPLAGRVREAWLTELARQKKWPLFIKYYHPTEDLELQCNYLQALNETKNFTAANQFMQNLWLTGATLPDSCETIFATAYKAGKINPESIWARARLAIANNNQELISKLMGWLPAKQQEQLKLWQQVVAKPDLVAQKELFQEQDPNTKEILLDGFNRWAKKDPKKLSNVWQQIKNNYSLDEKEQQTIQKTIAIALARENDPNAASWLATIKPEYVDQRLREWRVRNALAKNDWKKALDWIAQLSPEERVTSIWRYWYARALAMTGQQAPAQEIYKDLAKKVDYYGLLASQQLHQPYKPDNVALSVDPRVIAQVQNIPAIQRAKELLALKRIVDARREWQWASDEMNKNQLRVATQLAYQMNWYDRAIVNAAKAGDWNNLMVRFPLAYPGEIKTAAKKAEINPAWVYAIMRQESNFMPDAKSEVGAIGLMQLMPSTAKIFAKKNISEQELLNSKTNINLGTLYLKELSDWSKGNLLTASAAYNLGPTRLRKWVVLYKTMPQDIWVEILPWQETRDYVKAVLLNTTIYEQKLKS